MSNNFPATEEEKKRFLQTGKALHFPLSADGTVESEEERAVRVIKSDWINELVKWPDNILEVPIFISGAIIEGPIKLSFTDFKYQFSVIDSIFLDDVNLSSGNFRRYMDIANSEFQKSFNMSSTQVNYDLQMSGARFRGKAVFGRLRVDQSIKAHGTRFEEADFDRVTVSKSVFFLPASKDGKLTPARFNGKARFTNCTISGYSDFSGAQFLDEVDFNNAGFHGVRFSCFAQDDTVLSCDFNGKAKFSNCAINGNSDFRGAQFLDEVDFNNTSSDGADFSCFAQNDTVLSCNFTGKAKITNCTINGFSNFSGAKFLDEVDFNNTSFDGAGFRCFAQDDTVLSCTFNGAAKFRNVSFGKTVEFEGAEFYKPADFSAIKCESYLIFRQFDHLKTAIKTIFHDEARFSYADIKRNAIFKGVVFKGDVNFEELSVAGDAIFNPIVTEDGIEPVFFNGAARFVNAVLEKNAVFESAQFKGPANFDGAVIGGNAFFRPFDSQKQQVPTLFNGEARFMRTRFKGTAEFMGAVFNSLAEFRYVQVEGTALFGPSAKGKVLLKTFFNGEANFYNAAFRDEAVFQGATFRQNAVFRIAIFERNAHFSRFLHEGKVHSTTFEADASFRGAKFNSELNCKSAQFGGLADFHSIQVKGAAGFDYYVGGKDAILTTFDGNAVFEAAYFGSNCFFSGAQFNGIAFFNGSQINGELIFDATTLDTKVVNFKKDVVFNGCSVDKNTVFRGTQFHGAGFFRRFSTKGNLVFETFAAEGKTHQVAFHGPSYFSQSRIVGDLSFRAVKFCKSSFFDRIIVGSDCFFIGFSGGRKHLKTRFGENADFNNSKFNNLFDFSNVALGRSMNFGRVDVQGSARFHGTMFKELILREANFHRANFSANNESKTGKPVNKQFQGKVDLVGFNYSRIDVDWNELLEQAAPFDRQPFTYLENIYRSSGHDIQADNIYLLRRRRENNIRWAQFLGKDNTQELTFPQKISGIFPALLRNKKSKLRELPFIIFDGIEKWLFNYGIRPFRLLFISLFVLMLGVLFFVQPDSVVRKESRLRDGSSVQLSYGDAFNVSLNQFIPIVEIPPGSEWKPSEVRAPLLGYLGMSFAGYATLHRLAGFLLIPLGIAALTGRLYRRGK